jgi:hypothetical protein
MIPTASPAEARARFRDGLVVPTSGWCDGFTQANLVVVPQEWAYDVLHSRAIEHLLARPAHAIAFDRDYVLVWRNDRFSAAEFAQAADLGCDLLDMLPNYVVDELRRGA